MGSERKPFFSSAFWPGIAMGLLSVIPILNYVNLACCLWVILGGVFAVVVFKQETGNVTPGQGAFLGFLAGIIGAFVSAIGAGILWVFFGESNLAKAQEILSGSQIDQSVEEMISVVMGNPWVIIAVSLIGWLVINSIMCTLGGLLGAAFLKKKNPPVQTAQSDNTNNGT
jgi:hypothetical protein